MDNDEYTYNVRIWGIREHVSKAKSELAKPEAKRKRTYSLRWIVEGRDKDCTDSFATYPAAESRQMELTLAVKKGEAFHIESGLPMSEYRRKVERETAELAEQEAAKSAATCLQHFMAFYDAKWPKLQPNSKTALANTLSTVTAALVTTRDGAPDRKTLNHVLVKYVFNLNNRDKQPPKAEYVAALEWIKKHSAPAKDLAEDKTFRLAMEGISFQPTTGKKAAASTVSRNRAGLHQALEYLVEQDVLDVNPLANPKWKRFGKQAARTKQIDKRVVTNPVHVEALITNCAKYGTTGEWLQAFYALAYYAMMRPSEVMDLTEDCFTLPKAPAPGQRETRWGRVRFHSADSQPGKQWTDDEKGRDSKALKQRDDGEERDVPLHPNAVAWVRRHLRQFKIPAGGRMFPSLRGSGRSIDKTTYNSVWRFTRKETLTLRQFKSRLARRVYDLRHGGVSLMLNACVPPTLIAEWAGHGLDVLLRIYAKCIEGQEEIALALIERSVTNFEQQALAAEEEPGDDTADDANDEDDPDADFDDEDDTEDEEDK
ncbi:hypothetical protein KGQ20_04310 [Catenulispora sp. NF23]|uniref:Tyr recombinase domain-containing protein n=1 Tax=Catenulispora pinistramenti TaxID=2705254 RepID=A0ABS5L0E7_9ACTN|nr:hypothetical protein [Catenulispora pinistramenti]MBS2531987.1 hypothetical protein [Catenulispora pinistramenti]MBS2551817.1 hypothetical protein [Catenulispora pinistramenti]